VSVGPSRRARIGLIAGPVLFAAALLAPPPAGLTPAGWRAAAVGLFMAAWWVTEAIPIAATALLPLVLFPLLGILPLDATAAPYANPVIFLFLGGFLIAAGLQRCGLHRRLALAIIRLGGATPRRLIGSFMAATAFLSMWVSNTATVAMLLPMALSILDLADEQAAQGRGPGEHFAPALLLGLAYAASIGGLGTLIGTPPNALLAGFMAESYGVHIGFVEWMALGVPLVAVALPLAWLLLTRVLHPVSDTPLAGGADALRAQAASLGPLSRAEWTVGTITALTAAAWVLRPILARFVPGLSDAGIAVGGGLLLFVAPVATGGGRALTWEAAEELPWGVLVLFGGGLSLAHAIQTTRLAEWIGGAMMPLGGWPVVGVVAAVTTVIVFLTELTSNTATAAAFLPIVASLAGAIGAAPLMLAVPTALAASCAFMLPVATPPNAIVFGSRRLTIPQMARAGFLLNLMMIVLVTAAAVLAAPLLLGGSS